MTLSLRNTLIKLTLTISITLFLLYMISFFYLNQDNLFSLNRIIAILSEQNSTSVESIAKSLNWTVITASVLFGFSIISSLLLFHYFKKKISPEIFFFILFILSLSLQSIRLFQFQLLLLNVSPFFGVIITRLYYFFKLFGLFCLFASSLFPVGIKFQKFGTILISILLISFTISALMPIDSTSMNSYFLYNIGDSSSILLMTLSIRILTIVNLTRVAITTKSRNYVLVLIAAALIIAGDELLLLLPIPLVAFFMISIGTVMYSRSIYNYYLWI
jgi:hypothetical protein